MNNPTDTLKKLDLYGKEPTPKTNGHHCQGRLGSAIYGEAIEECVEDVNGVFWAGNQEYASAVRFCPYCGKEAEVWDYQSASDQLFTQLFGPQTGWLPHPIMRMRPNDEMRWTPFFGQKKAIP